MNINQLIIFLLIAALIVFIIARQVGERKVKKFTFIFVPAITLYEAYSLFPGHSIPAYQICECIIIILAGIVSAAIQSAFIKVYNKGNQLYMKGGIISLLAWLIFMIFRYTVRFFFNRGDVASSFNTTGWILFLGIAATFGFRSLFLYMRYSEIRELF